MPPERQSDSSSIFARWTRLSLRARGVAVLAVPLAALFGALFSFYGLQVGIEQADRMAARASDARASLLQVHIFLLDLDTALAGYLTTHAPRYLAASDADRIDADRSLKNTASLVDDDPAAIASISDIRRLLRQAMPGAAIRTPPEPGVLETTSAAIPTLQERVATLQRAQEGRLAAARAARDVIRQRFFRIATLCGVFGPLGALFVHLILTSRLVRRVQAVEENARRLAHGLPLEPLDSGHDEIAGLSRQIEDAAFLLRDRERELRDSEARYRELFDQAPIPYEEADREGVIRRFNQAVCALLNCSPDRILGRRAWDFLAPEQQEPFRAAMMDRLESGTDRATYESEYFLEDGSRLTVEIRETLIRDTSGEVTGVCRSLMDVTERNLATMAARKVQQYAMELRNKNEQLGRALDAARSATEAKSRFLAGISHELRTPLNGIIGFSELMYDGRVGPVSEEHREFLSDILTSARHLLLLINDILDLSKVEAGKMEFRPERRTLQSMVQEVCDVLRPLADKKEMKLAWDVPPEVSVMLDPSRFKQVLYNFLSNAVKFTPTGGQVTVRVALSENSHFRVEVEDTGIGIAADEIPLLFREFQQLPNSRRAEQGTGLGLALTRTIVEAQGGKVAVRSRLGRGSVFSAELPLDTTTVLSNHT